MKAFLIAASIMAIALQGCSFRLPGPQSGRILTVSTNGGGAGRPMGIRADVAFKGAVESPTLAIVSMPDQGPLQVAAYARPALPFMGLGVFPVDRESEHRVTVEATVVLTKPGTYMLEALSGSGGEVTATAALEVQ